MANATYYANSSSNEKYTGKIEFSLDTKAPVISAVGIESGESYKESYRQLIITLTDSSPATASVKLNNEDVAFYESKDGLSTDEACLAYDAATGEYILNVPAKNMVGKQNLVITATDAANNSDDAVIQDFQIYTNPFYAFVNGGGLLVTIIILFILLIVLLLLLMKKKKEEQAPKIEQMK